MIPMDRAWRVDQYWYKSTLSFVIHWGDMNQRKLKTEYTVNPIQSQNTGKHIQTQNTVKYIQITIYCKSHTKYMKSIK